MPEPKEYAASAELSAAAMRSLNQGVALVARAVAESNNGQMIVTEREIGLALPDGHDPASVPVEAGFALGEAKIMAAQAMMLGALMLTIKEQPGPIFTVTDSWPADMFTADGARLGMRP
jgi:hypothetical protein